ncbi:hypothetical protein ACFSTD_12220 [Novosphingobium colocasiae]
MTEVEQISYRDGQTALTGLLVRPAHPARAALVLYPTIANHNEAMKRRAAMFAQAGFLVMVADFYGSNPVDFPQAHQWGAALRDDTPRLSRPLHRRTRSAAKPPRNRRPADGCGGVLHGRASRAGNGARRA